MIDRRTMLRGTAAFMAATGPCSRRRDFDQRHRF